MPKPPKPAPPKKSAAPHKPTAPRRDATAELLFAAVELALDDYFSDPDNQEKYETWSSHAGRRRGRGGESHALQTWDFDDGDGVLLLAALAEANQFSASLDHPKFRAVVTGTYSTDTVAFSNPRLVTFAGSKKIAAETVEAWMDEMDEDFIDGPSVEEMIQALSAVHGEAGDSGDSSDPPAVDEADTKRVQQIARALARHISRETAPEMDGPDQAWLMSMPKALWPIVGGLTAACSAETRDQDLINAYNLMLVAQLESIRYRHDKGWEWATRLLEDYQQRIIDIARDGKIQQTDWFELAAALTRAKVPVKPEIKQQLADAGVAADVPEGADLEAMRAMIGQMAGMVDRPFDVIEAFSELAAVLPTAIRTFMALELALAPHQVLRDAVPLMLLDSEAEVRRQAAVALEQTADPDTMSPEALRRIIAVRNWVPEPDRAGIDRAIRKARAKGVACAQWPPAGDLVILMSAIDGSGAQSVLVTSRVGKKTTLVGLLLKQGVGVNESWCDRDSPARELTAMVREARQRTGSVEVERACMDTIVQHTIAIGLAAGKVPGPDLLDVAEVLHAVDWQDRRLDIQAEAQLLFDALQPAQKTASGIEASLRRSLAWDDTIAETWFEDNPAVRTTVNTFADADDEAAARHVLTEVVTKSRATWAERFLLLALWARASKAPAMRSRWPDFTILAHLLCGDRPLEDIPLMRTIAERSVEVARSGIW